MERRVGDVVGISLNFRIGIVATLAILVVVLTFGYALLPTDKDTITFFALALTAAGTIGGTFYLAETIREQSLQQRKAEAFALMSRWNSPDLYHARSAWSRISHEFQQKGASAVKTLLLDDAEATTAMNVRHILNFLEEIALAIREEHANERLLQSAFKSIVIRAKEALSEWIPEHRRRTGRNDIWEEFDSLYTIWSTRHSGKTIG